nr:hypothetical protein KPHV_28840 [Kitasatospora purpeofusca]
MSSTAPHHEHRTPVTLAKPSQGNPHRVLLDAGVNREPCLDGDPETTPATPNALLITETGTTRPVNLPADASARRAAAEHYLGGAVSDNRHIVTCVHETPVIGITVRADSSTMPVNSFASAVLDILQHQCAERTLHGPVLLAGPPDEHGRPADLRAQQYEAIENLVQVMLDQLHASPGW